MFGVLLLALITGTIIGFAMSVPVGPVGLIVFQRSMLKSRLLGLVTGIGAALTDGFLASIGAFGIKFLWHFIGEHQIVFRLVGGIIIFIFGLIMVFSKEKPKIKQKDNAVSIIEHFISGVILTGTNPLAAFTFFFIFTRIGHKLGISGEGVATALVAGVVIGSFLWWIVLTYIAKKIGHRIRPDHFDLVNKCFGLAIALIGAAMIIGGLFRGI